MGPPVLLLTALICCRELVNGVKTQVLKDREKEKERIAEQKRKQDEHKRIITGAGGFPPVPNTQGAVAMNHWHNIWSRKNTTSRPATSTAHFRPGSTTSSATGPPYYPLTQIESRSTMAQNSLSNVEPGSTSSKASIISKLQGFQQISESLKGNVAQTRPANLPSLKLMSGNLGEGAANIAQAKKKPKKKKKKSRKK